MKVFQFHLQKVLDVKEKEKEQAEWAFGKSIQRKNEEEWKLGQLHELHEEATGMLHSAQAQTVSVAHLMEITRYRQSVERSISNQKLTVYGCEQEMERCQQHLTERMKETQLWHKLREKAHRQFLEAEKQREQKELDEIGTQLYLRKSN
ncbi:flagellar export protein FliJ [Brevibacillus borstelensis]|uniref:flagellar export protein FliJ n=1 Tax=Brevibacillus borstelensis TaxID=45462 RepID=UPI0030C5FA6D